MKLKRLLSTLMCMALIFTLLPMTAWAAQGSDFAITGNSTGYTYDASGVLTFTQDGTYTVSMAEGVTQTTTDRIVIASGVTADITLSGVDIDVSGANQCAFDMTGATVNLTLAGINSLKSSGSYAGLRCPDGAVLTIDGTGSLTAEKIYINMSNQYGAGIGGGDGEAGGNITINDGTVIGISNDEGAGIGGGINGNGGTVTINGGTVEASGGGSGIGGGDGGGGGTVTINGGTVKAYGGDHFGAGIGGGEDGDGGTVTITGGIVSANGSEGAGIGGGSSFMSFGGAGGTVSISGGSVTAYSTYGTGIGGGLGGGSAGGAGTTEITGGSVKVSSIQGTPTNGLDAVYLTTVTLDGVSAETAVSALTTNPDYNYGTNDMYTDTGGVVYLYLPVSTVTSAAMTAFANYTGSVTTKTDAATSLGTLIPETADLSVAITDNADVATPGGSVTYTITAANAGPSVVTGATVTCALPAGMTSTGWTAVASGGATATACGSGDISDTANLPVGGSVTYTVTASIDSAVTGTLATTATISVPSGIVDPNTVDNSATDTDTLISSDAALSGLSISQGVLSPSFDASTYSYAASVANSVSSLTVTPTANNANATITMNSTAVTSGTASTDIALSVGANTIAIEVTAQDGTTTQTYTITVTRAQASGGGVIINDPDYKADVSGSGTLDVKVDKASGNAAVTADEDLGAGIMGGGDETVAVPTIPGVTSYTLGIPLAYLTTPSGGSLMFRTDTGSISLPADMLSVLSEAQGEKAEITIGAGDKSELSEAAKAAIGDRPLIELSLTLDGEQTEWSNPDAPVTVSIPYAPTEYELQNPDAIVVWYLDGDGNPICVPSGRYDEASGTVAFTTTHFSIYAVAYNDVSFSDVSGWYEDYVDFVSARGIMTGTDSDTFSPNGTMTRAMFVTVLYRLSSDTSSYTNNFSDVLFGEWYENAAAWASANGISNGVGNGKFAPDLNVTREQLVVMLYRYSEHMRYDVSVGEDTNILSYNDALDISDYAYSALQWACGAGILEGDGAGNLSPQGYATRAEAAAILQRFITLTASN